VGVCTELLEHLTDTNRALRLLNENVTEAWISVPDNRMGPADCNEHQRVYIAPELKLLLWQYYEQVDVQSVKGYLLAHVSGPRELPNVSVLIPSIGRPTLKRTLDSLLAQSYQKWEAIVAFNNAKDNPAIGYSDPRIQYMDLGDVVKDTGATPRNEAFQYARGWYIATLDDDDWWEKSFLWIMLREIKKQGVDLLYCRTNLHSRDGLEVYGTWFKEFDPGVLPAAGYILSPSVLFRREMMEGYKLHADAAGRNSDWRFYVDRYRAGFSFGHVDKTLTNLCVDPRVWRHWAPGGFSNNGG
jgi:glycosyltransferase involved in cell wall biosynthesis